MRGQLRGEGGAPPLGVRVLDLITVSGVSEQAFVEHPLHAIYWSRHVLEYQTGRLPALESSVESAKKLDRFRD